MIEKTELEFAFVPIDQRPDSAHPHPELAALFESGRFQEVLDRRATFLERLRRFDAIVLLGISGFYSQIWTHLVSIKRTPEYQLDVADLEFLQLLLTSSRGDPGGSTATPDDLPSLWTETRLQYFAEINNERLDSLGAEKAQLAARIRSHSAYYRSPYGLKFVSHLLTSVAATLDSNAAGHHAHRFSSFAKLLLYLIEIINARLSHVQEQIKLAHEPGTDLVSLAGTLAAATPQAKQLYDKVFAPDLPYHELQYLCYCMIERSSWQIFCFTSSEIISFNQDPSYDPISDLKLCATEFSKTSPYAISKIWYKPFVYSGDSFYLFSPYTVLSFPFHLLMSLGVPSSPGFKARIESIRGKFLEGEAKNTFQKHFPSSTVLSNVYWHEDNGDRVETDLLVITGDHLLIVEAKGAILPDKLITGHYSRSKTFLRDTFGSGNLQTVRLLRRLEKCANLQLFDAKGNMIWRLSSSSFTECTPIVLTMEELGIIANARKLLEAAGISNANLFEAMPTMIAELDYLLDLLPDETSRLHYLSRRSKLFRQRTVLGDELDLFALYVIVGFSAEIFDRDELIWALGASYSLKNYVNDAGVLEPPDSSTVKDTPYFARLLSCLEQSKSVQNANASLLIRDTPPAVQVAFERTMSAARFKVNTGRRKTVRHTYRVRSGISSHVLVGTLCRGIPEVKKGSYLERVLADAIAEAGTDEGLLIDLQPEASKAPLVSVIHRKREVVHQTVLD